MKFDTIKPFLCALAVWFVFAYTYEAAYAGLRDNTLIDAGKHFIYSTSLTPIDPNIKKASLGSKLFEDVRLSFNGKMSCALCHIDKFGSSDGLRNSIGIGGEGEGSERLDSDGLVVPRNSLPLWGRGESDFQTFFWDGKVEKEGGKVRSQFGDYAPSNDPLTVAIHLPFVEIREMVNDDYEVKSSLKTESVKSAEKIYDRLLERVKENQEYVSAFDELYFLKLDEIEFIHIADAIKVFIQSKFRLQKTRFEKYVKQESVLSPDEVAGGLIFFGKGKCVSCHSGRHFTDFKYHSIPFVQAGFGKNGFGVDYGRFNVTHDPDDLYKFRTPPLTNVEKTAPYGHSGSALTMEEAVIYHFDPLRLISTENMTPLERSEFYKKLLASSEDSELIPYLDDDEVDTLILFLKTLSYEESSE
ncbi:MAG: hypothetical protein JKX72_00255 [Robiginitomaculum sp.]|nr:hypothetical protein [Robiginitomaculum sp.]